MISEVALSSLGLEHGVCMWGWRRRWVCGQPFPVPCWIFHCFYLECGINHCTVLNRGVSWMCLHFRKLSCKKYRRCNGRETLRIVVQLLSHVWLCDPVNCSALGLPVIHRPGVCSDLCLLSQWCHPTILSSVVPFSSCLQSFPASGSFPVSRLFASGGQSIGASASASVLPVNIQGWFSLRLTGSVLHCAGEGSQLEVSCLREMRGPITLTVAEGGGFANLWAVRQDLENN